MWRRSIGSLRIARAFCTDSEAYKIEKAKALALSAYLLIRDYKSRGHEEAELDPLRSRSVS